MPNFKTRLLILLAAAMSACHVRAADSDGEWGNLSGRIVFDGRLDDPIVTGMQGLIQIPAPAPLQPAPGANPRVIATVRDERLLIDPQSRGVQNVFVYLRKKPERVNAELTATRPGAVEVVSRDYRFSPHVLFVQTGQAVRMLSPGGNTSFHVDSLKNEPFNPIVTLDTPAQWTPRIAEPLPIPLRSTVQPWYSAYMLVLDHPYAAISKADGTFAIDKLPVGEHELTIWHEVPGWIAKKMPITVRAGQTTELEPIRMTVQHLKRH
jgi:hypothetical protein